MRRIVSVCLVLGLGLVFGCGKTTSVMQPTAQVAAPFANAPQPASAQQPAKAARRVTTTAGRVAQPSGRASVPGGARDSLASSVDYADENGNPINPPQGHGSAWEGGTYTLPVGLNYSDEIKGSDAWNLQATQLLLLEFANRGYQLDPSAIRVVSTDSSTTVYFAWTIPGVDPHVRQPAVVVHTQPAHVYGRYGGNYWSTTFSTQVFAEVLSDSSGWIVPVFEGADAPLLVCAVYASNTTGADSLGPTVPDGMADASTKQYEQDIQTYIKQLYVEWQRTPCSLRQSIVAATAGLATGCLMAATWPYVAAATGLAGGGLATQAAAGVANALWTVGPSAAAALYAQAMYRCP